MAHSLSFNSYGKSAVRLTKVVRRGNVHDLFEITADIQLQGDFVPAYESADNRNVIATDTIKNTVYVVAKENNFADIEHFAIILARHFIKFYPQVTTADVQLRQTAWQRIDVNNKPHDHAFTSAGPQLRIGGAQLQCNGNLKLTGGVRDLLVLKTTASEWKDFHTDRYRTLKDTSDRIMATKIDADWTYNVVDTNFDDATAKITNAILQTFATQHSLGVQQTLLQMGRLALDACSAIDSIHFALPNQHRIPFNLEPFGLKFENDIFIATDEPYGLIQGTITRGQ